jgi:hypothetical protein
VATISQERAIDSGVGSLGLDFTRLKDEHRRLRVGFPESVALRTHRALSWLQRAELEPGDNDARFLFLWIAFNAAYARDFATSERFTDRRGRMSLLRDLDAADTDNLLYNAVWKNFPGTIRTFLRNRYVFQPFWDSQNGRISKEEWEAKFHLSNRAVTKALGRVNTVRVLAILFERLYVLRNQLVHGGSTWNSGINRSQVADGANIMAVFVPIVIHVIMRAPHRPWGDPCYPVLAD